MYHYLEILKSKIGRKNHYLEFLKSKIGKKNHYILPKNVF
jgi:hypothetical protein